MDIHIKKETVGSIDGQEIIQFALENASGVRVCILNLGGIITQIHAPDRTGNLDDIVLGYDDVNRYLENPSYYGAIIGRYANRIAEGKFKLEGEQYQLAINNGPNALHGGLKGFDKYIWVAQEFQDGIALCRTSPDMEEGFPGEMEVEVQYRLTSSNELRIEYEASVNRTSIINLTNHSYFNLNGHGNKSIDNHMLEIFSDQFTPVDQNLIPTGKLQSVEGTPFDFRAATRLGDRFGEKHPQIEIAGTFDHNYVMRKSTEEINLVARVHSPDTGRILEVLTTEPGMQLYCGKFNDERTSKGGKQYKGHAAFCLETQHFPDSPNQAHFPSTIISPEKTFKSTTIYRFSA